jgi:hypothetical protein
MTDKDAMLASCDEKIMGESAAVAGGMVLWALLLAMFM